MFFFFHLFCGLILGLFLSDLFHDQRWLLPCITGAVLPDLIDKPLGYLLFPVTIGYGRVYCHTLLVAIVIIIIGGAIWKMKQDPGVISLGVGILSHQVLDLMWLEPMNWYYPIFGPFVGSVGAQDMMTLLVREMRNPFELIIACLLVIVVLVFLYRHEMVIFLCRRLPGVSIIATAGAFLLCIISGMIIGWGISRHTIPEIGWTNPEELLISGMVMAVSAYLVWHWRDTICRE